MPHLSPINWLFTMLCSCLMIVSLSAIFWWMPSMQNSVSSISLKSSNLSTPW